MKQIVMAALIVAGVIIAVDYVNSYAGNPLARLLPAA